MRNLIVVLRGLLILAEMISGLVALVWLGICREWHVLIAGVLLYFWSGNILNILLLVTTPLSLYTVHLLNRGKFISPLQFLHTLLTAWIMGVLSCGVMYILVTLAEEPDHWTPLMMASFSVSVGAILHMAAKNDAPSGGFGISSVMAVLVAFLFIAVAVAIRALGLSFKATCIAYAAGCLVIAVICHGISIHLMAQMGPAPSTLYNQEEEIP